MRNGEIQLGGNKKKNNKITTFVQQDFRRQSLDESKNSIGMSVKISI